MNVTDLTEEQREALDLLESRTSDLKINEREDRSTFLLKWLVARDFHVEKAEEMLRNSITWRKRNRMDEILEWEPPEVLKLYYPAAIVGSDNDGCPVMVVAFGRCDIQGLLRATGKQGFARCTFQLLERCLEYDSNKKARPKQIVAIFDMDGLSLRNVLCKADVALEIVRDFENNYPEMLKVAYVINTPGVFKLLFDLIKPLITMRTMGKIAIFGYDRGTWERAILATVPADQLSPQLGGQNAENDGYWSSEAFLGGRVPSKYLTAVND